MHVLYFIDNLGSGGAQRQAVELARRLKLEHGVRMSFGVYRDIGFYAPRLREISIPIQVVHRGRMVDPAFALRLRSCISALAPDIIHAFLIRPAFWCLLATRMLPRARRPLLIAGERCHPKGQDRRGVESALQHLVYRGADCVTGNALVAVDSIQSQLGIPSSRVHFLPNGIDLEDWDREANRDCPLPLDPQRFQIALIGGFREQKNHRMLLEALSRIEPARLARWQVWFVGEESDTKEYPVWVRAEIKRRALGEHVHVAPATPHIAALMRHLDTLVLPSFIEGFPNVLLEAMASRLPAIATPVGEVPNMLEHERTGLLVPLNDVTALVSALCRIEAMAPQERRQMGERARAVVEARYRIGSVAQSHLQLYRTLLGARRRGPGGRENGRSDPRGAE